MNTMTSFTAPASAATGTTSKALALETGGGLSIGRQGREILAGVSLALAAPQVVGILGANGAGKSTLLSALSGELGCQAGWIRLGGEALSDQSPRQQARRRAVLPQQSSLGFDLQVDEVVRMGGYPFPELSPEDLETLAHRAVVVADAQPLMGRRYQALSGGEQQRVQFARVVLQCLASRAQGEPCTLLLDEPTASLDPRHQHGLLHAAQRLAREEGIAVLAVLHDVNLAATWCDALMLLASGAVVAMGSPREVLTPETLAQVYDMPVYVMPHPQVAERPLVLFG